ncbi:MAG: xanthine dehydrogenase family protein subunit M [Chloroflexi bacterium]|nr:xanthine dehydrogenase family protein subunit M [Chloroflexota bacterium]
MRTFEYARAETIDDATTQVASPSADGNGRRPIALPVQDGRRFLAGGTDLLTLMKADVFAPSMLVDIKRVADIPHGIDERGDGGAAIGALTTLSEIERHAGLAARFPALVAAVGQAATPQLRNMATMGGNLLQRPRCWYFRSSLFPCWLKGGDECHARDGENSHHAIFGESPCVAVHPSDAAAALVAYGATVRLRGPHGERTLSVEELFAEPTDDRRTETLVEPDELVLAVELPAPAAGSRSAYLKAMDRKVWAFALAGVAVALTLDGGRITTARVVLGGVAPIPWRAHDAESALTGQAVSAEVLNRAADMALGGAHPLEHNGYKVVLARNLVRKALHDVAGP